MAIDKVQIDKNDNTFDLQKELKGKNIPGSKVSLTLRRLSGKLEDVVLERIPTSQIADKRQMFDHFIRLQVVCCRSASILSPMPRSFKLGCIRLDERLMSICAAGPSAQAARS